MLSAPVSVIIQFLRKCLWSVLRNISAWNRNTTGPLLLTPSVNLNHGHFDSLYISSSVTYQTNTILYRWFNTSIQHWLVSLRDLTRLNQCIDTDEAQASSTAAQMTRIPKFPLSHTGPAHISQLFLISLSGLASSQVEVWWSNGGSYVMSLNSNHRDPSL